MLRKIKNFLYTSAILLWLPLLGIFLALYLGGCASEQSKWEPLSLAVGQQLGAKP